MLMFETKSTGVPSRSGRPRSDRLLTPKIDFAAKMCAGSTSPRPNPSRECPSPAKVPNDPPPDFGQAPRNLLIDLL